jgi:hypothetical protein
MGIELAGAALEGVMAANAEEAATRIARAGFLIVFPSLSFFQAIDTPRPTVTLQMRNVPDADCIESAHG